MRLEASLISSTSCASLIISEFATPFCSRRTGLLSQHRFAREELASFRNTVLLAKNWPPFATPFCSRRTGLISQHRLAREDSFQVPCVFARRRTSCLVFTSRSRRAGGRRFLAQPDGLKMCPKKDPIPFQHGSGRQCQLAAERLKVPPMLPTISPSEKGGRAGHEMGTGAAPTRCSPSRSPRCVSA